MTIQTQAPANWYPDPSGSGQLRWWDGAQWTDHYQPAPLAAPAQYVSQAPVIVNQRKMYKTSHGLHLFLTIVTLGLWAPVWIIMAIYNSSRA